MANDLFKPQRANADTINDLSNKDFGKNYEKLYEYQQVQVATNLTEMLVKMNKIELKDSLADTRLDTFWVDDTEYGKGYKLYIQDLLKVQQFSTSETSDWYPTDPQQPSDREILIQDRIQGKIRFDYNDIIFLQYFTSAEKLAEYINGIVDSAIQTKAVYIQQFIYNCYRGVSEASVWTSVVDDAFKTYVEPFILKIKQAFKNIKSVKFALPTSTAKNEIRKTQLILLVKTLNLKIALAIEKANLTNSMGSVSNPVHIKPTKNDIVVLMNQEDLIDINIYVRSGLFNAQFLEMPNVNIIQMSHVPLGSFYIHDRKFLQISKNLDKVANQQINANTLYYVNALHFWMYIGVVPYVYGEKVSIDYTEPVALNTVVTVLALGEFTGTPKANDIDARVANLNKSYVLGNATFSAITTTGAKMTGINLYTGDVALTYTVK